MTNPRNPASLFRHPQIAQDAAKVANYNPGNAIERMEAAKALQRLMKASSTAERGEVLALTRRGRQGGLGLKQPWWVYRMAGEIWSRTKDTPEELRAGMTLPERIVQTVIARIGGSLERAAPKGGRPKRRA